MSENNSPSTNQAGEKPVWYKTWWFWTIVVAVVAVGAYFMFFA